MWILPKQLHTLESVQATGALSLDSKEFCQLCAQSLTVRSKVLPVQTWSRKWKLDAWMQLLYGRTLKPSHGTSFETEWTSSLEATPVSHSAQQDNEKEKTTQDISGPGSQTEFGFSDQSSVCLKTSKGTFRWDSPQSLVTWKNLVTKRRGEYSVRLNAARPIKGSVSLSWPTVRASEHKDVGPVGSKSHRHMLGKHYLCAVVTQEEKFGPHAQGSLNTHGSREESWSTPTVTDASPMSPEMRPSRIATGRTTEYLARQSQWDGGRGKLNPRWVETLMGLPVGWTMPSCLHPIAIPALTAMMSSAGNAEDTTRTVRALDQIATTTDSREHELRLLGNGVVPATAAVAFTTLLQQLNQTKK